MKDRCAKDPKTRKELAERVYGALQYSVRDNIYSYQQSISEIRHIFETIGFKLTDRTLTFYVARRKKNCDVVKEQISREMLSFYDNTGKELPLNVLASQKEMRVYPFISSEDKKFLAYNANNVIQLFGALDKVIGNEAADNLVKRWERACDERISYIEGNDFTKLTSELNGIYDSKADPNAEYYITTDPLDVILKSTARTWEPQNCERIGGGSQLGIDSDIKHNTAMVYIRDKRKKGFFSAIARMQIRPCVYDKEASKSELKKRYSIGWDINWYRGNHTHQRYHIYSNGIFYPLKLTANEARRELVEIIGSKGFNTKYRKCYTPFHHEGFSDIEYDKNKMIHYQSEWEYRCERCGTPVRNDYAEREDWSGMCPYHDEHPDRP